jgi:hypothetical protein
VGVFIQRGEPLKIAYHVRMFVLEKIFCATTIVLAGISKNKNKNFGGAAAANFGAGGDANLIHFFIWPKLGPSIHKISILLEFGISLNSVNPLMAN